MAKYLIVNADDFGLCASANDAVKDLFRSGRLFSSTVMTVCPSADDALKFACENPQYAIGVHLTMTNEWKSYHWKPLTGGDSLVNEAGNMHRSTEDVEKNAKLAHLREELNAQIDYALARGLHPSHIDNHMGSLYGNRTGRFSMLNMTLAEMGKRGYAFRLYAKTDKRLAPAGTPVPVYMISGALTSLLAKIHRVTLPDYMLFPDWPAMDRTALKNAASPEEKAASYDEYKKEILRLWTNIPDGVTETFLHPAYETDELKEICGGGWYQRVLEYRLMKDPDTHEYLKQHGVTMISWRDLTAMKGK